MAAPMLLVRLGVAAVRKGHRHLLTYCDPIQRLVCDLITTRRSLGMVFRNKFTT